MKTIDTVEPIEYGIIGVGKHGKRHIKEMLSQGVKVDAVDSFADIEGVRNEFVGEDFDISNGSVQDFVNRTDALGIVIATPGNTHFDVAREALEAGKHVLVEKPFTFIEEEARVLIEMARNRDRILMVGHNRSYLPHFRKMKEIIESGRIGTIVSIEGNYLNPPQKFDTTHTALEGLGYHQIYMINEMFSGEGFTDIVRAVRTEDFETYGVHLMYGDVPVFIRLSRNHDGEKTRNIIVTGERGKVVFDYSGEPEETKLWVEEEGNREDFILMGDDAKPSLFHQFKAFRSAVENGVRPETTGEEAIHVVRAISKIRDSAANDIVAAYSSKYYLLK